MEWTLQRVRERFLYWWEYENYCADYKPLATVVDYSAPKRKRTTYQAPFVKLAEENIFFDQCFGKLSEFEQILLLDLYMHRSKWYTRRYGAQTISYIGVIWGGYSQVAKIMGLPYDEVKEKAHEAMKKLLEELNR
jgi:hypothetical protein